MSNKENKLTTEDFVKCATNINSANSSIMENKSGIFLPYKNIEKTIVAKVFSDNDREMTMYEDDNVLIKIKGRLLGQHHKDVLEVLLSEKLQFNTGTSNFSLNITAYRILKKLDIDSSNKKYLIKKLSEISQSRVWIKYKKTNKIIDFGFIDTISDEAIKEKDIWVHFTKGYTHFMGISELKDYSVFIPHIVKIKEPLIKSMVRYMLMQKGNNSQISIEKLINEKLRITSYLTSKQISQKIKILESNQMQKYLASHFGIRLTNNNKTITFNNSNKILELDNEVKTVISDKKHYVFQPALKFT